MRSVIYIIAIIFLYSVAGCGHRCNRSKLKKYTFPPEMHVYFDVFKEGNWWVYSNTSKTLSDSVFVSGFEERMDENCQFEYTRFIRHMNLNYKYIFTDLVGSTEYKTVRMTYETRRGGGTAAFSDSNSPSFLIKYDGMNFIDGGSNQIQKESILINGVPYKDIISNLGVSFEPGVGIVRIATKQDTFLLHKFNVQ